MNQYSIPRAARRNRAFTLVEIMVALAIMMLLLAIILVPVNMALNVFHIGKARNEVKAADQVVLNQLNAELRQATYVFPNEEMPGITSKPPYTKITGTTVGNKPYYDTGNNVAVSNTSRLDFLLPAISNNSVAAPLHATNYIVTYYARRLDTTKPYDTYANPVVLFRAQYPYKNDVSSSTNTANLVNATSSRYPANATNWLNQTQGEPDLSTESNISPPNPAVVADSETLITPRDMALVATNAAATPTPNYQPDSSFTCDDSDGDGKIDRVTINLNMAKYDAIGAQSTSQQVRLSQTVDLPNVK